jgi:hypothetical protein
VTTALSAPLTLAVPSHGRMFAAFCQQDSRYRAAQAKCDQKLDARRALPPGSSRARVTTANAGWMRACEARDRIVAGLRATFDSTSKPWEMPGDAWRAEVDSLGYDPSGMSAPANHHAAGNRVIARITRKLWLKAYLRTPVRDDGIEGLITHRDVVEQAIADGWDVPAGIRSEYP